jgi:hypothetical protein
MFAVIKTFVTDISASTGKFDTNERVGVFLARHSVQHLVFDLPKKKTHKKPSTFLSFCSYLVYFLLMQIIRNL